MTSAPNTVTIHLTRHGRTWLNELDRVQGWSDSPLTAAGKEVAVRLGHGLGEAGMTIDAAYSADMVRHRETAETILDAMGADIPVTVTPNLREMSFGGFEGAPNKEMFRAVLDEAHVDDPEQILKQGSGQGLVFDFADRVGAANPEPTMPTETPQQVADRMLWELENIATSAADNGQADVLVVSSGVAILVVLHALGHPVDKEIRNASLSTLVYADGQWTVEGANDTSLIGE